jgi:rubredoxin
MDNDFIQQFVCSDCRLVYDEVLVFDSHHPDRDRICPRCGAGNGYVSTIECIYDTAWASLMRL